MKISVITICYNSESTIERTILSVLSQDFPDVEYILIDGVSKDRTMDIVRRYSEQIDIVISEPDNGISHAFNKGIQKASGDLIVLVNSDDYLLPGVLRQVAETWDGESDIWSGNYIASTNDNNDCYRIRPSLDFPVMPFFRRPVHQGRFITKKLYDRIGMYDESIRYPMDLDFLMRATRAGAKFQYVDTDVAVFALGGATSYSIFDKRDDYIRLVRNNGGSILQAYIFYAFLVVTQQTKRLLGKTGKDIVRILRYKKHNRL